MDLASTPANHNSNFYPDFQPDTELADGEPLQDEELAKFRLKVLEMGIQTPLEKELARMVLRLTDTRPSSAQIVNQASVIIQLNLQREHIIRQAEEQRAFWEMERDGWARASEALIAQRNKIIEHSNERQDLERYCSMLQAENDNLRQKEERLLKRLSCLEEEMVKLKPVLLYQPFLATDSASSLENASAYLASLPYPAASGKEAASMRRAKLSRKKRLRVEEVDAATDRDGGDSFIIAEGSAADRKEDNFGVASRANPEIAVDSRADNGNASPRSHDFPESLFLEKDSPSIQVGVPADRVATRTEAPGTLLLRLPHTSTQVHSMPSQPLGAPSASAHRKSERLRLASAAHQDRGNKSVSETIAPPTPSSFSRFATPVTSDARTEHLLLAARMIGRKRAATAAGITDSERERELFDKAKDRKDKRKVARTPKSPASESVELEDKVKVKATSKRGSSYGKKTSTAATRTAKRLPMQSEVDYSAAGQGNPIQAQLSPQTALTRMDSLLSAASMMVSGAELSETTSGPTGGQILASGMGTRRPSSIFEDPEILPPAKRRRNGLLDDSDPQSARSALDVLADQAAVAESSSTNSVIRDTGRRGRTKSKGRKEGAENERYSRDAAIVTDSLEFNVNEVRQGSVSLAYSQNPGPRLISAPESFLSGRPDFRNSTSSNPSGEGF